MSMRSELMSCRLRSVSRDASLFRRITQLESRVEVLEEEVLEEAVFFPKDQPEPETKRPLSRDARKDYPDIAKPEDQPGPEGTGRDFCHDGHGKCDCSRCTNHQAAPDALFAAIDEMEVAYEAGGPIVFDVKDVIARLKELRELDDSADGQ